MSNLLNISSSPHVRDKSSTKSIMWDVFLALMPATAVGIFNFGLKAAILIVACVATAVLTEYIWQKAMKRWSRREGLLSVKKRRTEKRRMAR